MKKLSISSLILVLSCAAMAQTAITGNKPVLATYTAQEDHDNMMKQLGIKKLRPGPSGNENAPNHANYDESIANPCPQLQDVLTLKNGKKVATPDMWWKQRRPEPVSYTHLRAHET